jgi:hypothetical protein
MQKRRSIQIETEMKLETGWTYNNSTTPKINEAFT